MLPRKDGEGALVFSSRGERGGIGINAMSQAVQESSQPDLTAKPPRFKENPGDH